MRKILIVEDEKMIRYGIYVMIEESGVSCREITECRNGKEALGFLEKDRYRQRWSVSFISFWKRTDTTLFSRMSECR